MNKKQTKFVCILVTLFLIFIQIGCGTASEEDDPPETGEEERALERPPMEEMIVSSEHWKDEYPLIYQSFINTSRAKDWEIEDTSLGGLHPIDYLERYPEIAILYDGIGFGKEYFAARGHYYSLDDVINTSRPKPGASCLACKTGEYEYLHVKYGDEMFAMDFHTTVQEVQHPISCYNCHRNEPGKNIHVTLPHLDNAIENLNLEIDPGTRACAQCHVEYFLEPETKEVILPWDNGLGVDEIEAYFDERDFYDWKHPRTGTPLIKVQHPEFEMYTGSIHDGFGISCADCHMPTMEEEGETYTSHWAKSPLKTVGESCGYCHGEGEQELIEWVEDIQKEIDAKKAEVSTLLVQLIEEFAEALEERSLDDDTVEELWSLHRKSQYRWDFVFVENSTGFHNADKSRKTLEDAKQYAEEALEILANHRE
ncbi:ammonia-forming cytochrome c nitrite reductase subunit c552 [Serpentinicella sp. ANB-PHB4]|uniref:ammonia-forming cytochrome c nitrite reductase subunit c552 n=1 Tax=Serpentinicella sp. ANB-PHB4 TaxID=3074076 RepID=UPI0028643166|nr:ammonia-forming cytochrome c nitrite reductase subunit c552 [Serpentinicella sp. ANB-PHB4]MDR5658009.1 ammonia-forming cytochrome c nitrite reductase subunit c552 [Serpentinicella sp. ANB-PHB4]